MPEKHPIRQNRVRGAMDPLGALKCLSRRFQKKAVKYLVLRRD